MPNRTNPEFWKDDLTLNHISRDAELFFYKLQQVRSDEQRFPIIPSPTEPRNLHAALFYLRKGVSITNVACWLAELQGSAERPGPIVVRNSERGWYGEILEPWHYRADDYTKGAPRHGPRAVKTDVHTQGSLPLPPVSVLRRVEMPGAGSKHSGYGYDNDHDPIPRPAAPLPRLQASTHADAMMNRSDAAGRESGSGANPKFARSPEMLLMSPVGKRLNAFVGRVQMTKEMLGADGRAPSGAYWLDLIENHAELLNELLDEGERRAVDFTDGKSRAMFLSKRLKERKAA